MDGETLLFTGFPGFIGARLVPRLLELRPQATVLCLVQERFQDAARQGLRQIEAAHPTARGRLDVVLGDITRPRLGLAEDEARRLQARVTSAYHLAAVYDLAVSRELGMRVNVEGTRNVVEFLAGAPRLERHHYVSTCYVAGDATGLFRETDLDVGQGFKNHYEETKYMAEVEVAKSGLPTTVYRPSIVVGDSRTGETGKFDGPYFTLSAMEMVPSHTVFMKIGSGSSPANVVPVDFVVEAMARLSVVPSSRGVTYQLADPEPPTVLETARLFARELGKTFIYVPVPKALAKAALRPAFVQRVLPMPPQTLDYYDHPVRFDTTNATRDLAALGIRCPRLADYVAPLVSFYRSHRGGVRRTAMI